MDCGLGIVSVESSYSLVNCLESCNLSKALIVQSNPQTVRSLEFSCLLTWMKVLFIYFSLGKSMFLSLTAVCLYSLLWSEPYKLLKAPLQFAFKGWVILPCWKIHCPTFVSKIKLFRAPSYEVKFVLRGLCHGLTSWSPICSLDRRLFQNWLGGFQVRIREHGISTVKPYAFLEHKYLHQGLLLWSQDTSEFFRRASVVDICSPVS